MIASKAVLSLEYVCLQLQADSALVQVTLREEKSWLEGMKLTAVF